MTDRVNRSSPAERGGRRCLRHVVLKVTSGSPVCPTLAKAVLLQLQEEILCSAYSSTHQDPSPNPAPSLPLKKMDITTQKHLRGQLHLANKMWLQRVDGTLRMRGAEAKEDERLTKVGGGGAGS